MDVIDCINGRRSIRTYLDKPVEKETIERILQAGAMAPSAMDGQPWRFVVITDRAKIRELSGIVKRNMGALGMGLRAAEFAKIKEDVIFYDAPLVIIVCAKRGKWSDLDCGLAIQNMLLAAYGMGLGSCCIGFACSLNNDKAALKELGIPSGHEIVLPLIFGYPKSLPKPKKRAAKVLKRFE